MVRAFLVAVAMLLALAPAAAAQSTNDIIRDCADDGRLDGDYTPSQLRRARNNLPADVDEYSDCRDLLNRASLSRRDSGSGGGGSGGGGQPGAPPGGGSGGSDVGAGPAPPNPDEQRALSEARAGAGERAIDVGGETVVPGAAGLSTGAAQNPLPSTVVIVLVLLALVVLAAAGPPLRKRVLARRRT